MLYGTTSLDRVLAVDLLAVASPSLFLPDVRKARTGSSENWFDLRRLDTFVSIPSTVHKKSAASTRQTVDQCRKNEALICIEEIEKLVQPRWGSKKT
jgi:hypothetical protein